MSRKKGSQKAVDLYAGLPRAEKHFRRKAQLIIDALERNAKQQAELFSIDYIEYTMTEIASLISLSRSSRMMRFLYEMKDRGLITMISKPATSGRALTEDNVFFLLNSHYENRPQTKPMFQETL